MEPQTISIKGMVCNRCLTTVETELLQMGHTPIRLTLGEASFIPNSSHDNTAIEKRLTSLGFGMLENKSVKMTREIKKLVAEIYDGDYDFPERFRFSDLVRKTFQKDYDTVSDAFIVTEKKTIERYIIEFRINKIKEYLVYTDLLLAEISNRLNFNSVAHLSAHFKKETGLTPSFFRSIRQQKSEASAKK